MTADDKRALREQVEEFLFQEAALLDGRVDLLTEDARYVVPATDLPEGDPGRNFVFIDDDIIRLRARVGRLNSRFSHRERPRSRTRRFVSNVRVAETEGKEVSVSANVLVYRFRAGEGAPCVGAVDYLLRRDGGELKIAYRRAVLDMEDLSWHGAVRVVF